MCASFFWELCKRASAEILSAKGTTLLGGVVLPAIGILLQFVIKVSRQGTKAFNKEEAIPGAIAVAVIWTLLFFLYLLWIVPKEIRGEALGHIPAINIPELPVSKLWDEDYKLRQRLRQEHDKEEALAASKGWITQDRQRHIVQTLSAYAKNSFAIPYIMIGNINEKRELLPIMEAVRSAGWPEMGKLFQSGGMVTMGGPPQITDRIYVIAEPEEPAGKILCKALAVPRYSPKDDPLVIGSHNLPRVVLVIKQPLL
jgi:hypothetical protein